MNKVFLTGNLTKDPDVRTTSSGVSVATFRIAVQRKFKDQSGEKVSDFFDIVVWRQLAELCGKYLNKGRKVAVAGELQTRSYDAKDGTKRYITEIVADEVEFLSPHGEQPSEAAEQTPKKSYRTEPTPETAQQQAPEGFADVEDDDLPF